MRNRDSRFDYLMDRLFLCRSIDASLNTVDFEAMDFNVDFQGRTFEC